MGNLTGQRIDLTYDGLIKTNDEQPISATLKGLQDGVGNNLPIEVSTSTVNFTGTVTGDNNTTYDLTAAENIPDAIITLTGSDGSIDNVTLQAGTGIALSVAGNVIDVSATSVAAAYTINVVQNGVNVDLQLLEDAIVVDTITLQAGGNVSITQVGQAVVFAATDTNTTYTLDAAQNGANVEIQLDGSDATTDVVTLAAGTNITLTQAGSEITIDAAGGGGTKNIFLFTTGTIDTWPGPSGQDVIISQVTIPANTITGAAHIEYRSPVLDNPNGQFNYTGFQIAPIPGDFNYISLLGRQGSAPTEEFWYRSINIASNGDAYYKDHNGYDWASNQSPDPIVQITNMDWTVDNYFTVTVWCDDPGASFIVYSPTIIITTL